MEYEIVGDTLPVVICHLNKGEKMISDSGAMAWMDPCMKMETNGGGAGKIIGRIFSGETLFRNSYTANKDGLIAFASSFPGKIVAIDVEPGKEVIIQKSAFLASEENVETSVFFNKKFSSCTFIYFIIFGVDFVCFTTHFCGGFASGAQIYSYYVRFGIWCLIMPALAMLYNGIFFAYGMRFARKHEVYDYRSYNNAFYGKFAPVFSNLFEVLYICVMCVAPAVAFATGGATLSTLTGLPYLLCTLIIGIFIFIVAIFGTDLVRRVASVLSICIIAGLLIVYIPNIIHGWSAIRATAQQMTTSTQPFGKALYSAFLYGTFQLANIAVFVQHAKVFKKPGDAVKSMGPATPSYWLSQPPPKNRRKGYFLHDR